jgi:hypothetical protein
MPKCIQHSLGDQFGSWTVIERDKTDKCGNLRWICKCRCGKIQSVSGTNLRKGKSTACKSCGGKRQPKPKGNKSPHWTGCGEISGKHWDSVLRHAKNRGHVVEISIEDAWALVLKQKRRCAFTGLGLLFGMNQTASLDRIDSTKGYVSGNVQWVHKTMNLMKNRLPEGEFIEWCRLVTDRQLSVLD